MYLRTDLLHTITMVTALSRAVSNGSLTAARRLIEEGVDINAMSGTERIHRHTVLHIACGVHGSFEMAQLILSHNADANIVSEATELTPLHIAAIGGRAHIVQLLLHWGATVDKVDAFNGNTPLMHCIHGITKYGNLPGRDHIEVVKMLIEAGGGVNICNRYGTSPLHEATKVGSLDIMKLLVENGAVVEARDDRGHRPLDVVVRPIDVEVRVSVQQYIFDQTIRVQTERETKRIRRLCIQQFQAFAMGHHHRLGRNSIVRTLTPDSLPQILKALCKEHGLPVEE
jgi:ankyrin repeat protein